MRRKNERSLKQIQFSTVLFKSFTLMDYYDMLDSLENFSKLNIDKFTYLMGYCGENDRAESFFSQMKMKSEFDKNLFYRFTDCSRLSAEPHDLLVLKKNSKYNSLEGNEVIELDGRKMDIARIKEFFQHE